MVGMLAVLTAPGCSASAAPVETQSAARACLATAIAYEAGREPVEGQQAVAEVVLNRVRLSGYPKTVCGVIYAGAERRTGCQFTFACDGALRRKLPDALLAGADAVAVSALAGANPVRVYGATHYHADYVLPYWASSLIRITKIGAHIFYRSITAGGMTSFPQFAAGDTPDAGISVASAPVSIATPAVSRVFAPWGLSPGR